MLPIVWLPAARRNLATIIAFIAEHNPSAARCAVTPMGRKMGASYEKDVVASAKEQAAVSGGRE